MAVKDQEQGEYFWKNSDGGSLSMSRKLSAIERMFVLLNQELFGQNCPFIGATISVQRQYLSHKKQKFSFEELQKRAVAAFSQTRWKYPTVAARVVDGDKALYNVDSKDDVDVWAERTVTTIKQDESWLALREELSRNSPLPTKDGDYCVVYLVVRPDVASLPELTTFDVLLHIHHAFTDGSGIRSILNEFLARLADPLPSKDIVWGKEIERLYPPSILLEKDDNGKTTNGEIAPSKSTDRLRSLFEPDIGLPLYRPDILLPDPKHRGTLAISHTFEQPSFLHQLLAVGRMHGVKLTALLQAAMLRAVYNLADVKPSSEELYKNSAAIDLRTNHLIGPYNERNKYVNNAVALETFEIPVSLFNTGDFWQLASHLADQWAIMKTEKDFAKIAESDAQTFMGAMRNSSNPSNGAPVKPRTCPYYVSDPPGSQQLSATYTVSHYEGLQFVLESYQLATDQSQAVVSARSHSWNGRLTLCLVFNAVRNPREKMQEFLDEWVRIVGEVESGA